MSTWLFAAQNKKGFSIVEALVAITIVSALFLVASSLFEPVRRASQSDKVARAMQSLENMLTTALEDPANYTNILARVTNGETIDFDLGGITIAQFVPTNPSFATSYDIDLNPCAGGLTCVIDVRVFVDTSSPGNERILYNIAPNGRFRGATPPRFLGARFDPGTNTFVSSSTTTAIGGVSVEDITDGFFEIPNEFINPNAEECDDSYREVAVKGFTTTGRTAGVTTPICWKRPLDYSYSYTDSNGVAGTTTGPCPPGQFPSGVRIENTTSFGKNTNRFVYTCSAYRSVSCANPHQALASIVESDLDSRLPQGLPQSTCAPVYADTISYTPVDASGNPANTVYCPNEHLPASPALGIRYTLNPSTPVGSRAPSSTTRSCILDQAGLGLNAQSETGSIFVNTPAFTNIVATEVYEGAPEDDVYKYEVSATADRVTTASNEVACTRAVAQATASAQAKCDGSVSLLSHEPCEIDTETTFERVRGGRMENVTRKTASVDALFECRITY